MYTCSNWDLIKYLLFAPELFRVTSANKNTYVNNEKHFFVMGTNERMWLTIISTSPIILNWAAKGKWKELRVEIYT